MKHGGLRPGAGRPKGSVNRLTAAMVETANDGLHPFAYLLAIVRDEAQPVEMRIQAARAALPFCAHKLASMELTVEAHDSRRVEELTDAELYALIRQDRDGEAGGNVMGDPGVACEISIDDEFRS